MDAFKRGLSGKFIGALRRLSETKNWWRDVLDDDSLVIGIREEYLNVYWRGQSIFRIEYEGETLVVTTHPKYLLDPALSKQVRFDGWKFDTGEIEGGGLIQTYENRSTLKKLKKAAGLFAGEEKCGVHEIVIANENVVDVEIAMRARDVQDAGALPRADIATFEKGNEGVHLCFWEAKTFYNPELRPSGKKNVVEQMEKYKAVVSHLRPEIVKSYTRVAGNLAAIADMSPERRRISDSTREVARGAPLTLRQPVDVGLIVFGFDAAQEKHTWDQLHTDLAARIDASRIKAAGNPKNIRL